MGVDKGSVETAHCGVVDSIGDALHWPSGRDLLDWLGSQGFHYTDSHGLGTSATNVSPDVYWQTSARWALLTKYGFLPATLNDRYKIVDGWKRLLEFSSEDVAAIQDAWQQMATATMDARPLSEQLQQVPMNNQNELTDFITTSKSNGKQLKWSFLLCGSACQFKLHAHANIELIYCAKGALHEVRMDGSPIEIECSSQLDGSCPSLLSLQRKWSFNTLHQGEWLVNEVGSIHKSFTATSGEGCVLLVLWSGSHWNVTEGDEPTSINIGQAVNQMDERLGTCSDCSKWDTIQEVFLPDSEKSSAP